ncbi:hypothetical protein HALLA_19780 (plasmid) [Halostagnicola larsenii XH-48]|uniref:Histidine kinase n=1 Tax=Halostagnicola larsenii XH-48 TaxID=797299 RepID=W0JU63_9EURY|nr:bacterio-opsin activator domain-containing protein [Halostagnicola larsenii]AHG02141.1 hypothetical protein HALLA_19780 [Halostagnicola larsenii XH-48]
MSDDIPHDVALVSTADRSRLKPAFDEDDRVSVHQISDPAEDTPPYAATGQTGIVLELEDPETVKAVLERIQPGNTAQKVVVAPRNGSERLATVAFREGATDYVFEQSTTAAVDRIVDALEQQATHLGQVGIPMGHAVDEDEQLFGRALPEEAFIIDENGTYLDAQISADASNLYSLPADDLIGLKLDDVFPTPVATELQNCVTRTIESGEIQSIEYTAQTVEGVRRFEARVVLIDEPINDVRAVVWLARDITDLRAKQQKLRSRHERLERTNEINEIIKEVIKTVVEAPTRSAIERNVCDRLVESDLYRCAVIAGIGSESSVLYRVGSGGMDSELKALLEQNLEYDRLLETGEIQSFSNGTHGNQLPEPLANIGTDHDINSAIVVPIDHDEVVYGVLAVFATRTNAFGSRECDSFRLLGESIGFSINAVKNRQLLFSDSVVELEIRIDDGNAISFDLSEKYDCTCSLKWAGTTTSGKTYQYVLVDGIDGEIVREEANQHDSVQECRVVHSGNQQCIIELRLVESGVRALSNLGVAIRDITVEDNVGTCLLDVPRDADIREILNALGRIYQNTELVARREVDRSVQTMAEKQDRILDTLTEKQLTTLRLAYYGGYFDWPRGSTGEEIAQAMDVAPPTMHQHLRKALQELLREFLEEGTRTNFDI